MNKKINNNKLIDYFVNQADIILKYTERSFLLNFKFENLFTKK